MKQNHYVTNKDLLVELSGFQDSGVMSEELGGMILKIAEQFATKGNFASYTYKDDMIAEAVLTCCRYIKNFDANRSKNPFSYITQICLNSFINYIKIQNKHSLIKDTMYKRMVESSGK